MLTENSLQFTGGIKDHPFVSNRNHAWTIFPIGAVQRPVEACTNWVPRNILDKAREILADCCEIWVMSVEFLDQSTDGWGWSV
jgi:hypothetical protein